MHLNPRGKRMLAIMGSRSENFGQQGDLSILIFVSNVKVFTLENSLSDDCCYIFVSHFTGRFGF